VHAGRSALLDARTTKKIRSLAHAARGIFQHEVSICASRGMLGGAGRNRL